MITRNALLYLSQHKTLRHWMEQSPRARRLTRRYIAGLTLADELAVAREMQTQGIFIALDHLGENVTTLREADGSVTAYLAALDQIAQQKLPATISIKLTQFGLDLSEEACVENLRTLAAKANETGTRVEIDMESRVYTQKTLDIVMRVAREFGCLRCVIQAYLYRSESDIARMNELAIPVRLCKGAYNEPANVAMPNKADVDASYVKLMKQLLDRGKYPALATHDDRIVEQALAYTKRQGIGPERFEFQMLYGIRRDLQKRVLDSDHRLRLYVPYGEAWYPYFMRRLAERPANIWFLLKSAGR